MFAGLSYHSFIHSLLEMGLHLKFCKPFLEDRLIKDQDTSKTAVNITTTLFYLFQILLVPNRRYPP